jgi:putative multiple sugar transport system substrate-binding protein
VASASEQLVAIVVPGESGDTWDRGTEVLRDELEHDGYRVEVHQSGDDIPTQLGQLDEVIEQKPVVLVIAPIDDTSLTNRLDAAAEAGISVVAFDRLPRDTSGVDYVVTYDHVLAGRQQAWSLLAGLGLTTRAGVPLAEPAEGPFSIELLAGSGDDPAAALRFQGAAEALAPYLTDGTIVVPSGRVDFEQAAILRGAPDVAADRVSELLAAGVHLDGVLSPRDAMSRAVLEVLPVADEPDARPTIVTGGGAQLASINSILDGAQSSTVLEDPRSLGAATARLVRHHAHRITANVSTDSVIDNGAVEVPAVLVDPVAVDADDVERTIIDSGYWTRAQLDR